MSQVLTLNTGLLYALQISALVMLMRLGRAYRRLSEALTCPGARRTACRNKRLPVARLGCGRVLAVDNLLRMFQHSHYDSPLAGPLAWLLPGARKPPPGRFSHFCGCPKHRSGRWRGIACLHFSRVVPYTMRNTATTLSAPSGGIAQPWWLFYARWSGAGGVGVARC